MIQKFISNNNHDDSINHVDDVLDAVVLLKKAEALFMKCPGQLNSYFQIGLKDSLPSCLIYQIHSDKIDWQKSECSCRDFQKNYKCFHITGKAN
ncbi:hypothetical protein BpHYR1_015795 [Brachionus plicatilis]|uniref:SWIM-type domain-containing protein n=1 Tax=Brachionus plicatilis TaxID=10195 RepID=A0A3M7T3W8_BRAPC|nr:hypothetical protein BpHYR1_015795 [Brachionus plicatilis]